MGVGHHVLLVAQLAEGPCAPPYRPVVGALIMLDQSISRSACLSRLARYLPCNRPAHGPSARKFPHIYRYQGVSLSNHFAAVSAAVAAVSAAVAAVCSCVAGASRRPEGILETREILAISGSRSLDHGQCDSEPFHCSCTQKISPETVPGTTHTRHTRTVSSCPTSIHHTVIVIRPSGARHPSHVAYSVEAAPIPGTLRRWT